MSGSSSPPALETKVYDAVIVGGGISGMALAIGLMRRDITDVLVLEKASVMHPVGASIAIFSNGLNALDYISPSVSKKVRESCIPIESMVVKDLDGRKLREKKPQTPVRYMVWYLLQKYLAEEVPEGVLLLGHAVESFEVGDRDEIVKISVSNRRTSETFTIKSRVLVGADGIHSPVREQMFGSDAVKKFYHGKVMFRAVLPASDIENSPPTGTNVTFQGDEAGKLFSYRETAKDILTVTAMACFDNEPSSPVDKKQQMLQVFQEYPEEVQSVMKHISPGAIHIDAIRDIDVLGNDSHGWSKGPVVVIGDAAHAMSPSMGQGANQGLEDACVLVHFLAKALSFYHDGNLDGNTPSASITSQLTDFYQKRIDRVKSIHAASRARSMSNNKTTSRAPIDMNSLELRKVLEEIDNWDAPIYEMCR